MELHAKIKGALGELAVAKHLVSLGYPVFTELGDNSKVDLIVLTPAPIRVQVKARYSSGGSCMVDSRKSGPNYRFRYTEDDVDIFALYIIDRDLIAFISCRELLERSTTTTFRIDPTTANNNHGIRLISDYFDFRKALRDYTGDTLTDCAEGNEIVQTTTVDFDRPEKLGVVGKPEGVGSTPTGGTFCTCGKRISKRSKRCKSCVPKQYKIIWPPKEELVLWVKNSSFVHVARELGVSDNAIRKHLKN